MAPSSAGPGLAAVRPGKLITSRTIRLLAVRDAWWARIIDRADVVSEGAVAAEQCGDVYYGSTSVRLTLDPRPEPARHFDELMVARLLLADPHARARLVRLAHREAVSRARRPLSVLQVELTACGVVQGDGSVSVPVLDVQIDVSAAVLEQAQSRGRQRLAGGGGRTPLASRP